MAGWHALSLRRAWWDASHALRRLRACHPAKSQLIYMPGLIFLRSREILLVVLTLCVKTQTRLALNCEAQSIFAPIAPALPVLAVAPGMCDGRSIPSSPLSAGPVVPALPNFRPPPSSGGRAVDDKFAGGRNCLVPQRAGPIVRRLHTDAGYLGRGRDLASRRNRN